MVNKGFPLGIPFGNCHIQGIYNQFLVTFIRNHPPYYIICIYIRNKSTSSRIRFLPLRRLYLYTQSWFGLVALKLRFRISFGYFIALLDLVVVTFFLDLLSPAMSSYTISRLTCVPAYYNTFISHLSVYFFSSRKPWNYLLKILIMCFFSSSSFIFLSSDLFVAV